jgi:hypothetical protein
MKNIYKKIGEGIAMVPKAMYGCCNWGGVPGEYLVSTDISKLLWIKLDVDDLDKFGYIYEAICIIVTRDFYDRQESV